jgi:hypothetical protein
VTGRRRRRAGHGDRGSVTAELAAALPALVLFTAVALGAVGAVTRKLECVDAARDAALTAARGGDGGPAGAAHAPPGATISIVGGAGVVRASCRVSVRPMSRFGPGFTVAGVAVAAVEGPLP